MDNEIPIPNSLKGTYSSKANALIALEMIKRELNTNTNTNTDLQVLLQTSNSFIKCDIDFENPSMTPLKETDVEGKLALDLSCITNFRNLLINKLEAENPDILPRDNGSVVHLKNVKIYSNGLSTAPAHPTIILDEYVVFSDQIVGFSLIPRTAGE